MYYTYFTIKDVALIDSSQFILSCLDKLSSILNKDQFRETRKYLESFYVQQLNQPLTNIVTEGGEEIETMHFYKDYRNHPYQLPTLMPDQQQQIQENLALMMQEGVDPYEYMDSFERFQESQWPPKDPFYSSLTEGEISEIDYTHTQRALNHFDLTDIRDYHNFYLLTNVLLLADVFREF